MRHWRYRVTDLPLKLPGSVLLVTALLAAAPARAREEIDRRIAADPDVRVDVENVAGSIRVEAWERAEVAISGSLGDDAEGLFVSGEGSDIEIEVEIPEGRGGWHRRDIDAHLVLRVPRGASLTMETVSASIEVREVAGELDLESVSGSIEAAGEPREAHLETVSGSIRFTGIETRVDAESVSGSIRLEGVAREVEVSTVSGSVEVRSGEAGRVELDSVSGTVRFEGALSRDGRLDASSHSGNVDLILPSDTSAHFEVETFSGDIRNDFGPPAERVSRYGPGKRVEFTTGSGGARVTVETFAGNVDLRRR